MFRRATIPKKRVPFARAGHTRQPPQPSGEPEEACRPQGKERYSTLPSEQRRVVDQDPLRADRVRVRCRPRALGPAA